MPAFTQQSIVYGLKLPKHKKGMHHKELLYDASAVAVKSASTTSYENYRFIPILRQPLYVQPAIGQDALVSAYPSFCPQQI